MAEGVDADAARYQRTTVHGTVSGGPSLEISDREEGSRGTTERDLTLLTALRDSSPIQAWNMRISRTKDVYACALHFAFPHFAARPDRTGRTRLSI